MDNSSAQTEKSSFIDTVKLLLSAAALFSGLFSYYYFLQVSLPLRVLMVLGGLFVGTAIAMTSFQGKQLFSFIQSSRIEIRKVVWPSNQETSQTTIAVFVFTLVMGIFFWGLDSFLLWLTRALVGSAG